MCLDNLGFCLLTVVSKTSTQIKIAPDDLESVQKIIAFKI